MDLSGRELRLPLDEAVAVLRDLDAFVVSLDRLGSRMASGTADARTIGEFVLTHDVTRRLSHARHVLSVALDTQLTPAENAAIDTLCAEPPLPTPDPD
ncbi:hypothetical protein ABZ135_16815 [Streptomyces sp. NPDC006339]|uniref:hypothetical protein n=1 Tax=Streptomyces sp. NPDC006339 TaxID=3156755 RepID=UPI0033AD0FD3